MNNTNKPKVGILVFNNADVLDIFGPSEVFLLAEFEVRFLGFQSNITLPGQIQLQTVQIDSEEKFDLFVIPGGEGILSILEDAEKLAAINLFAKRVNTVASICAGALILAAIDLLKGKSATTHWLSKNLLKKFPDVNVVDSRVVVAGNTYTSGGISSGIDLALMYIENFAGTSKRKEIELLMEYKMSVSQSSMLFFEKDDYSKEYNSLASDFNNDTGYKRNAVIDTLLNIKAV